MGNFNVECLFVNIVLKETIKNCANGLLSNKSKINKNDGYDLLYTYLLFIMYLFIYDLLLGFSL